MKTVTVVQRLLKQHEALKSYFESEEESVNQDRLARLKKRFSDPMTEVYLLFYQAILPVFTSVNLMLQRTALMIYLVRGFLFSLVRNTMGKFIRPELLTMSDEQLVQIDFSNSENQLKANKLFTGFTTKQFLNRLAADKLNRGRFKKSMQVLEISTWQLYHTCSKISLWGMKFCTMLLSATLN